MDSDSPLFSTDGSLLSVLGVLFLIVAVFLAVVCLAMVLVTVRRWLVAEDDEVAELSTDQPPPPPEVIGRWVPVAGCAALRKRYHRRFVTVVVRSDFFEMPIVIELKQWRMVIAVKLDIYYATGYLLSRQRLNHHGERPDDFYQLDDYGWQNGQCVEMKVDFLVSL